MFDLNVVDRFAAAGLVILAIWLFAVVARVKIFSREAATESEI